MSKREILGGAVRAIREAKAAQPATADHDPTRYIGSHFAIACLMSSGHLCNIEKGRKPRVSIEAIYRIASQLQVPIDAISYEVAESAHNREKAAA